MSGVAEKNLLPTGIPEEEGIPSSSILNFIKCLEANHLCMHSVIILRSGKIVSEGYWSPFTVDKKHRMYSTSKSFVSVAIGLMEGEGLLSLDDRVITFFPEKLPLKGVHPYIEKMTIRDLLMMASAHEKTTFKQVDDDDWVRTFFTVPPTHLPGTVFSYDTSATITLTAIIEKVSGMSLLEYMHPRLLTPIGFSEDAYCLKTPLGVSNGGSAIFCTSRDLAKFALTCMQEGNFDGKQLIPADYIKAATSYQIDTTNSTFNYIDNQQGYGYKFWRTRNNGFSLQGMGGQLAVCLPDKDLLIVTTADTQPNPDGLQTILNAIWNEIYPHLSDVPLMSDEKSFRELFEKTSNLSILLPEGQSSSPVIESINGNTYQLTDNPMNITKLRVVFHEGEGILEYENDDGKQQIVFGFGKTIAQKFPVYDSDCIAAAAWKDENTLYINPMIIDDYFVHLRITLCFKDNTVTIVMKKYAERILGEYLGFASGVKI
ncbi:serine hydrolase [Paenibacillus agaridevorans]|uniref:Serine hydrolase n=1 Tax=Paenibacillus agaridevorans TaxID=171404 RepID=A0A2R5EJ02_9BACL|nr:serine hydrolase [Paenibacillus agaridevorans]GBG05599.1 serine hydrolase [Paenibacillus agaridevorans]